MHHTDAEAKRDYADPGPDASKYPRGEAGKGDVRRAAGADEATIASNWCRTFGHRFVFAEYDGPGLCQTCGVSADAELRDQILAGLRAGL